MRKTKLVSDHYYHLYNRGVNRGRIFFRPENWSFFLQRWRRYCRPELAEVVAYCLMPTHYHFLVYLQTDQFAQQVMHPFAISYTKAVNKDQNRIGPLFQGPFQAKLVDNDAALIHLTRYIHLNPVTAGHVPTPADWRYSSYREHIGQRDGTLPQTHHVLHQFRDPSHYQAFVEEEQKESRIVADLVFD